MHVHEKLFALDLLPACSCLAFGGDITVSHILQQDQALIYLATVNNWYLGWAYLFDAEDRSSGYQSKYCSW